MKAKAPTGLDRKRYAVALSDALNKKLGDNTRQENIACAIVFFGILAVAFSLPCAIYLLAWGWAFATVSALFAIAGALKFLKDANSNNDEPAAIPDGRLSVDADYFMPFSVCPKCDVEALHWMREPDEEAAERTVARFREKVDAWRAGEEAHWDRMDRLGKSGRRFYGETYWRSEKPKETAEVATAKKVIAGRIHVIRTCREPECGHEWGQKIWAP